MIENIFSIIYNILKEEIMKNYKDNLKKGEKKVKGFFGEFKTFIQRGNVIDLAVGVVLGGEFVKIVT